jgi:hypothetical protein
MQENLKKILLSLKVNNMNMINFAKIAILLVSINIGMIIGLIIQQRNVYHGPNAAKFCAPIYQHKKTGKCYKFGITLI